MFETELSREALLAQLMTHLHAERYSDKILECYPGPVRRFLDHLQRNGRTVLSVQHSDVERYLKSVRMLKKRPGCLIAGSLRKLHRAAIAMLMRLVRGEWPPRSPPLTNREIFEHEVLDGFEQWMREVRGLSTDRQKKRRSEAQRLLKWLAAPETALSRLTVMRLDAYVQERGAHMRRRALSNMISQVRGFLKYLHFTGAISSDLAATLRGPRMYDLEDIPSALRPEDIRQLLDSSRGVRTTQGRRDHAIFTLMATYGLRGGELIHLRLEDIDWRNEMLHIRHTKTNVESKLPLLPKPAAALLRYLKHGRPKTVAREVFVRSLAPYRGFTDSAGLYHAIDRYLSEDGKQCAGRKGAHAFRHARAVGLLRGAVPLKTIGDVLGHRSIRSTLVYLKLATQDLREVALEVPSGVAP
jgi:integrase/recombinase XerD